MRFDLIIAIGLCIKIIVPNKVSTFVALILKVIEIKNARQPMSPEIHIFIINIAVSIKLSY